MALACATGPASPSDRVREAATAPAEGSGLAIESSSAGSAQPGIDPVRSLQQRIESGDVALEYDSARGYLPSLLEALEIPASSQTLVFSRTSFQTDRIAPWAPRALYFNDDVYVGWVQEGPIMELISMSPQNGARFYSVLQQNEGPPRVKREGETCLLCHDSRITDGVPGLIMRSTLTDRLGYPVSVFHTGSTRDQTPFETRWGGWYVTGTHGEITHAGNLRSELLYEDIVFPERHIEELDKRAGANKAALDEYFDVSAYLTPHSDVVALMVLAHQVRIHNLMELVRARGAVAMGSTPPRPGARFRPITEPASGSTLDRLLRGILFADEVSLQAPVRGTSAFVDEFAALGPMDGAGRSLREFDLDTRLFRYPVSYLLYTPSFDALPGFARSYVYDGILEALTMDRLPPEFGHLASSDRDAILAILKDTKPEFARRSEGEGNR
ncbi:MAG: hypothetical protein HKO53_02315 [Gemmatimonadetes bacterium]|nr:hypothetical protein [Gemmatimonadota bacterium]